MQPLPVSPTDNSRNLPPDAPTAAPLPPPPADEMALGYEAALPYLREGEADWPA